MKPYKFLLAALFLFVILSLPSCFFHVVEDMVDLGTTAVYESVETPDMHEIINYQFKDVEINKDSSLSHLVLNVIQLKDKRGQDPNFKMLTTGKASHPFKDKAYCVNDEEKYKKGSASWQISTVLAKHINKRKTFKKVLLNRDSADYHLSGSLFSYFGRQDHVKSNPYNQFYKTYKVSQGSVIITLTDVKILDKDKKLIKDFGDIKRVYNYESMDDQECTCVYQAVDQKLKLFFNELIPKIESEIKSINQK
ncbi:MAG: hypothetical protein IPQ18_11295 [Saprospiraceae bacterium]|nr:hypothetical protein [Saprospiraceae bacterium]MBL0295357.1 hypothetical protein [Saprospiraceae bacterium]